MRPVANFLILSGILMGLFVGFLYWREGDPNRLSFEFSQEIKYDAVNPKPIGILIKDLNISLPVVLTEKHGGVWPTTDKGVSYAGSGIYYGHNWRSILGNLVNTKQGQEINLIFSDGEIKKYIVDSKQVVYPNESSILENLGDTRIAIYTCTGFLDTKRLVVIANLI